MSLWHSRKRHTLSRLSWRREAADNAVNRVSGVGTL